MGGKSSGLELRVSTPVEHVKTRLSESERFFLRYVELFAQFVGVECGCYGCDRGTQCDHFNLHPLSARTTEPPCLRRWSEADTTLLLGTRE